MVVDAGANHGDFARSCHTTFGCAPVLLEANPTLATELTRSSPFRVMHLALAETSGVVLFNISHNDEGSSVLPLPTESQFGSTLARQEYVPACSLQDMMTSLGANRITLLKMDIEGAETSVLLSAPRAVLASIDQITAEFHCETAFGFQLVNDVRRTLRRLRSEGFAVFICDPRLRDVLFINTATVPLSLITRLQLQADAFASRLAVRRGLCWAYVWQAMSRAWCSLPYGLRQRIKRFLPKLRQRSGRAS